MVVTSNIRPSGYNSSYSSFKRVVAIFIVLVAGSICGVAVMGGIAVEGHLGMITLHSRKLSDIGTGIIDVISHPPLLGRGLLRKEEEKDVISNNNWNDNNSGGHEDRFLMFEPEDS